jgi:aminoglycoside phosphotransferase (APT) family kinase protein/GTP-binding protein EngB required for normal cell division
MLRRQLADMTTRQEKQRARREGLRVALVGYTNAGKSSLMRALTGSEVLVEDKLFATLSSTVRALAPTTSPPILVSDTVGFIRNLPHDLVASFRSTLAEARDAGLLLHVVDAADPAWPEQMQVTRESIAAVGADEVRELVVLNKIDRVPAEERAALARALPGAIQVSALDPASVKELHRAIEAAFGADLVGELLEVPYTDGRALGEIRSRARVVAETFGDDGVVLAVRALPSDLEGWRHLVPERRKVETVADLLHAARKHGLDLVTESDDFDRSGLDFLVAHAHDGVGVPWVVRTPRRADVYEASRTEARALDLVKPRLPVQVPDWRVHAPDVIAYPRLPGLPAVTVDPLAGPAWNVIDPASPCQAFLDSVARTLVALQAIPTETARLAGVPRRSIDESRAALARAIEATAETLAPSERLRARWQRWLDDDSYWPDHLALAHGDLHPGHMLLAPDGTLLGILDWTEAQLTDPSVDFAMFHGCFGPGPLAELVDLFERAGGRTWPRMLDHAAERWAAFPAIAAEWALRTDNQQALDFARNEVAAAAEA